MVDYINFHKMRYVKTIDFINGKFDNILDIGGYPGTFANLLNNKFIDSKIFACDIDLNNLTDLNNHWIQTGDLEKSRLPFKSNTFDMVSCLEVIEHLYNADNLLQKIYRILKPNGIILLTTPNLASWANKLLLIFGYYPISMSISIQCNQLGKRDINLIPNAKKDIEQAKFDYHTKAYTYSSLKTLMDVHNYKILDKKCIYGQKSANKAFDILNNIVEYIIPSLSQVILIKAEAIK